MLPSRKLRSRFATRRQGEPRHGSIQEEDDGRQRETASAERDAVFDSEFGLGVVQAFRDAADEASVVVRFDDDGAKRVPLERAELRPLR